MPAITIGGGGRGRDAHALTESFDTTDAWKGTQHALLLTIALVQKGRPATKTQKHEENDKKKNARVWFFLFFSWFRAFVASLCRCCFAVCSCSDRQQADLRSIRGQNVLLITIDTLCADAPGVRRAGGDAGARPPGA